MKLFGLSLEILAIAILKLNTNKYLLGMGVAPPSWNVLNLYSLPIIPSRHTKTYCKNFKKIGLAVYEAQAKHTYIYSFLYKTYLEIALVLFSTYTKTNI